MGRPSRARQDDGIQFYVLVSQTRCCSVGGVICVRAEVVPAMARGYGRGNESHKSWGGTISRYWYVILAILLNHIRPCDSVLIETVVVPLGHLSHELDFVLQVCSRLDALFHGVIF